jgi:hypothetical protein
MRAVKCEDTYHGCPECSAMRWPKLRDIPRCFICGNANGLKRTKNGYVCMGPHIYEDGG